MFQRVIVVMPGATESRDALVLGSQSADADGVVVAANVLAAEPARLHGGPAGAARRAPTCVMRARRSTRRSVPTSACAT
jgi:hypothetical protein